MEPFNYKTNSFDHFPSFANKGEQGNSYWPEGINGKANSSVLDLHLPKKRKLEPTPTERDMYFTSEHGDQICTKDIPFKRQSKDLVEFFRKYHDGSNSLPNVLPSSDSCESLNERRIPRKIQCLQRDEPVISSSLLANYGFNNHQPGSYIGVESSQPQLFKNRAFPDLAPILTPFSSMPSLQNTTAHSGQTLATTLQRYSLPLATSITSCSEPTNLQHVTSTLQKSGQTSITNPPKLSEKYFSRLIGTVDTRGNNPSYGQEEVETEINKLKGKLADFIMKQNLLQSNVLDVDNNSSNGDDESQDISHERRKKNNEAAKRSRDARRLKEDETALRAGILEVENYQLRMELIKWQRESVRLTSIAEMINR